MADCRRYVTGVSPDAAGNRPHIVVSAYACRPERGSELAIGWETVLRLAERYRVTALTRAVYRPAIETALAERRPPDLAFYYLEAPGPLRVSEFGTRGLYPYYVLWQWRAAKHVRSLLAHDPFELVYHASICAIHMPIFMQRVPVPLIFGPVAGGELTPRRFWRGGGATAYAYEAFRAARMRLLRVDPAVRATLRGARRLLVATDDTRDFLPRDRRDTAAVLHTTGVEHGLPSTPVGRRDGSRVYCVGRLLHWKGFDLGIAAFARAASTRPDMTLTIVGDGPQRARLEALAASLGVAERVRFTGAVSRAETLEIAAESDLFLFPSLHDSGAMAIVEALALGVPVVCLDAGGARVSVSDECGVRVPVTNRSRVVSDLARALEWLLADAERRERMGAAGRKQVAEHFTWDVRAATLIDVLESARRRP